MNNELRAIWDRGDTAFGGWSISGSPFVTELLGLAGFDYVCIDAQHGFVGEDGVLACLLGLARTPTTPLVRVAANDLAGIGKVLDAGAQGVIVPAVESRADAERAVESCRMPPVGRRSFGPFRAAQAFGRDVDALSREVLCLVMIESVAGVENLEEICSTDGVDGVYVGPADLAISMGLAPTTVPVDGPHADAMSAVAAACERNGIIVGTQSASGADAHEMARWGYRMLTVSADAHLLRSSCETELRAARDAG